MKKLNKEGFTLIELLAVIVIMGILMMVAIPAMSSYINKAKADTYANTIKEYGNAVRTAYSAGILECNGVPCNSLTTGTYSVPMTRIKNELMETGGSSPYGGNLTGSIDIEITNGNAAFKAYVKDDKAGKFFYDVDITTLTANNVGTSQGGAFGNRYTEVDK